MELTSEAPAVVPKRLEILPRFALVAVADAEGANAAGAANTGVGVLILGLEPNI
jgi:hypothetical protein